MVQGKAKAKGGRGVKASRLSLGDPSAPDGFPVLVSRFLESLRVKNYSERTLKMREVELGLFMEWCHERSVLKPSEVTKAILERYQRYLYHYRKRNGGALSFGSQHSRLSSVSVFFKWLSRENYLPWNPSSELELPKLKRGLPRQTLSSKEVEKILSQADKGTVRGLRDRAIMEVLYSTGIRRAEAADLSIYDVNAERGTLMVRQGKGKKDRVVPIGERASGWLERYLDESRPHLLSDRDPGFLFLNYRGEGFSKEGLGVIVNRYVKRSGVREEGSCHLFRHAMATLMLENGADIRFIQQMLGHVSLETTQVYTHVSIHQLKKVHQATHPARLKRHKDEEVV